MTTPDPIVDAIDAALDSLIRFRELAAGSRVPTGWQVPYLGALARLNGGPLVSIGSVIDALAEAVSSSDLPGAELAAGYLQDASSSISDAARDHIDHAHDALMYSNR
jgi:hypothetical protein